MLPPARRLRRADEFTSVIREGVHARRGCLVVHHLSPLAPSDSCARVGLIVGKPVGGSVVRHRVSRRLRALVAARLTQLPAGSGTVIRAQPQAAQRDSAALGRDLDAALARLLGTEQGAR